MTFYFVLNKDILYVFYQQPLGAVDYLTIASTFDTLILRDIPNLTLERKTEGRRFTTLIDTVYDTKVMRPDSISNVMIYPK